MATATADAAIDSDPRASGPVGSAGEAAVPDASPFKPVDPCKLTPTPGNPTCNPPAPTAVMVRILAHNSKGPELVVVVVRTPDLPVTNQWHGQFSLESGRVVSDVILNVAEVKARTVELRAAGLKDLPRPDVLVRLYPP